MNTGERQREYLRYTISAQEQERQRLSRELHDDTAQGLIDTAHTVDDLIESSAHLPDFLSGRLHLLRQKLDDITENMRRIIQGLQPALLDEVGIRSAKIWLSESIAEEIGINVEYNIDLADKKLNQEVSMTLFHVAQEALNNIKQHSHASKAELSLKVNGKKAILTISDNGVGFILPNPSSVHVDEMLGLIGIRERVALLTVLSN